jgi:hypothetical protein
MGDAFDIARAHGQHRLGTVQGLDLAFFIDAQHQSVAGVQLQADNVPNLLHEEGIGGELKTAAVVGAATRKSETGDARWIGKSRRSRAACRMLHRLAHS